MPPPCPVLPDALFPLMVLLLMVSAPLTIPPMPPPSATPKSYLVLALLPTTVLLLMVSAL